jgi:hypothetical protein
MENFLGQLLCLRSGTEGASWVGAYRNT